MYLIIEIPGGLIIKLKLGLLLFDEYIHDEMVEKSENKM